MLESALENILLQYLAPYVDGITRDLQQGHLETEGLGLRAAAFGTLHPKTQRVVLQPLQKSEHRRSKGLKPLKGRANRQVPKWSSRLFVYMQPQTRQNPQKQRVHEGIFLAFARVQRTRIRKKAPVPTATSRAPGNPTVSGGSRVESLNPTYSLM